MGCDTSFTVYHNLKAVQYTLFIVVGTVLFCCCFIQVYAYKIIYKCEHYKYKPDVDQILPLAYFQVIVVLSLMIIYSSQ